MKILYLGNFENPYSDSTEKHIAYELEKLGHEVTKIDEKGVNPETLLTYKPDMFLFHKGNIGENGLPLLLQLLHYITGVKVCWYFDKIHSDRVFWAETIVPFVDHFFLTDESWARRHNYKNTHILRQGIGTEDMSLGTYKEKYKNDIVFLGSVYGERQKFVDGLVEVYGDKFKVVNTVFGRNLYDLCASTKIFVAPKHPQDDFYWSNRIYLILGSGGFLIHPRLEGLKEEFKDGENIVFYTNGADLKEKIDYYLTHDEEREKIRKAGYELVTSKYTFAHRVKNLMDTINAVKL